MVENSLTREILVSVSPSSAYRALTTDFDKWWATYTGESSKVGGVVTFRLDPTYWTMRVTKLAPNQLVEMECIEANHVVEGLTESIREEWVGTKLRWEIEPIGEGTRISFVHEGLTPSLNCHEICNAGWDRFFVNSLGDYLNNGVGTPVKIETKV